MVQDLPTHFLASPATDGAQNRRPFGRSISDFRDQSTPSGLLPAEERLVAAAAVGEQCLMPIWERSSGLRSALSELAGMADNALARIMAARLVARASNTEVPAYVTTWIAAQPAMVREVLDRLLEDADREAPLDPRLPDDLMATVTERPDVLATLVSRLVARWQHNANGWFAVDPADQSTVVRAGLLRCLALGGDAQHPVHELGVSLFGAHIVGRLDLDYCTRVAPLILTGCYFDSPIFAKSARIAGLDLRGSFVPQLMAPGVRVNGSLQLSDGFTVALAADLSGADIHGRLNLSGAHLGAAGGSDIALLVQSTRITGGALLNDGFCANGSVSFLSSTVGGSLECSTASIMKPHTSQIDFALSADAAKLESAVFLNQGFAARGRVSLLGATIRSTVSLSKGLFCNPTADGTGVALTMCSTRCAADVFMTDGFRAVGLVDLRDLECGNLYIAKAQFLNLKPGHEFARYFGISYRASTFAVQLGGAKVRDTLRLAADVVIAGCIDLRGAHVGDLEDRMEGWPRPCQGGEDGQEFACLVELDGFRFDRLHDGAPTDAESRLAIVEPWPPYFRALPASLVFRLRRRAGFRPQPYEQLVKVLREMGHEDQARKVTLIKQKRQRVANWLRPAKVLSDPSMSWPRSLARRLVYYLGLAVGALGLFVRWLFVGLMLGEGYSKVRPVALAVVILLGCGWFYGQAARQFAFVPSDPVIYDSADIRRACAGTTAAVSLTERIDWVNCKSPPRELTPFYPFVFSADVMLPLVDLGQKRDWKPVAQSVTLDFGGYLPALTLSELAVDRVVRVQRIGAIMIYLLIAAILTGVIKRD
jgi:hypothetical protein